MSEENTNQSWRKNPRKFAPRSKRGCRTCKIRRIKCDESRPSCQKCQSTGRVCDGYQEHPAPTSKQQNILTPEHNAGKNGRTAIGLSGNSHESQISVTKAVNGHLSLSAYASIIPRKIHGTLLAVSMAQSRSMSFFEHVSIQHLNKYQPTDELWRRTLMLFSQTVPAVQEAAIALSLLHQHRALNSTDQLDKQAPLIHYNRSIQLLLKQNGEEKDSTEQKAITLLVCYLFICFDHLAGNDVQAMKHLKSGLRLAKDSIATMVGDKNRFNSYKTTASSTDIDQLIHLVVKQLRRFDTQALMFLLDWIPDNIDLLKASQLPLTDFCFTSIDEAFHQMDIIVAKVMSFRNAKPGMNPTGETSSAVSSSPSKDILLTQMATWSHLFENMLLMDEPTVVSRMAVLDSDVLINLLRLRYEVGWIFLSSFGPGKEMEFDAFQSQFQRCIVLADHVAKGLESRSGSLKSTFTPEIGILPLLYVIGAKCRDSTIRREAVRILRRQNTQEAVWDSIHTAKALERIIEIEEGNEFGSTATRSMDQIAIRQRIEAVTWIWIREPLPRLDFIYTFCDCEGVHTESLAL